MGWGVEAWGAKTKADTVSYTCKSSVEETEAGGSLGLACQPTSQ